MVIRLLSLYLFFSIIVVLYGLSSTIIDNKIYTILYNADTTIYQVSVCDLREEVLTRIPNSCKAYDLIDPGVGFKVEILEVPKSLSEGNKKLWLRTKYDYMSSDVTNSTYINWMGNVNLVDMKLSIIPSIIKKPQFDKFPIFDYSSTTITNEYGSTLYIVGGLAKAFNTSYGWAYGNSFYKYNFTAEVWHNMALLSKGELPVIVNPSLTIIDNRYLYLVGGRVLSNSTISSELQTFNYQKSKFNSPYNLWVFDTLTNIWENVQLEVDIFDGIVEKLELVRILTTAYNNKIYAPVGVTLLKDLKDIEPSNKMGILDLKLRKWNWVPIINEDGNNFKKLLLNFNVMEFNDQIILSKVVSSNNNGIDIYVFDLLSQRMKSSLRLSKVIENNESDKENNIKDKETTSSLPTYGIALTAIGCTIALFLLLFYIYTTIKRNKSPSLTHKKKHKGRMQEVWANPDATNAENLYKLDKLKDNCNNNGTHTERNSFATKLFSNTLD